ncbi:MAG: hypothetical protein ACSW8C_00630 [bacterium]
MQRYAIIDTKAFDCRCLLFEHQNGHLVVLEDRQYLPPIPSASWQAKLPQTLKHISKNLPDTEFIFLLPDTAVIHLTVEVPTRTTIPLRENISHILYKDFKISPAKYCFQFAHLDGNRYIVSLVTRKFINFVKGALENNFDQIKILPFFIGQFAYIKQQASDENSVTIFIEKNLRRFFIHTSEETNFIDFYQPNTEGSDEFSNIRNTQQFISQTLDIPEGKKRLFLIGNVPDTLKDLYATEYGETPETSESSDKMLGCVERISGIAKCAYLGIDAMINGDLSHLDAFDFQKLPTYGYNNFPVRYRKPLAIFACICFIFSGIFFTKELQQYIHLRQKSSQIQRSEDAIERLQNINRYLLEKEQQSTLLPQLLLKYCYLLQTLPENFCIDHLGFEHADGQDFCSIRGRIYRENLESFKRALNEHLHNKLNFYSEPSDETIDNFSIRILLEPLPPLL